MGIFRYTYAKQKECLPDDGRNSTPCYFCGQFDLPWHRHKINENIEDYVCDTCEELMDDDGEFMDDIDVCASYKW